MEMAITTRTTRVSEEDLAPIVQHIAQAANLSHEAFLELAMSLEHVRRILPDDYKAIAAVLSGAFEQWQLIEEAADEVLGSQIVDLAPTGKPLPALGSGTRVLP
jgi:hypothetical protein